MLATPARELPRDDGGWAYEFKWDGVRALVFVEDGTARVQGRSRRDFTVQYPEVAGIGAALVEAGVRDAVIDGEVVALGRDGTPSFQALQRRMHVASPHDVRARMADTPVVFLAFDVLRLGDELLLDRPYTERRRRLEALELAANNWQTPPSQTGDGEAVLEVSRARNLEGVVAKRLDSVYEPGRRSRNWLKIKNKQRVELIIGGWQEGGGSRTGRIGALLVGYEQDDGLRYAGNVGSGFTDRMLGELRARLGPLARDTCPFVNPPRWPGLHYVEPVLRCEVEFTEWTDEFTLRHPVFKGLKESGPK
jgi:bifunctional non-homologous end joining protein LigD